MGRCKLPRPRNKYKYAVSALHISLVISDWSTSSGSLSASASVLVLCCWCVCVARPINFHVCLARASVPCICSCPRLWGCWRLWLRLRLNHHLSESFSATPLLTLKNDGRQHSCNTNNIYYYLMFVNRYSTSSATRFGIFACVHRKIVNISSHVEYY